MNIDFFDKPFLKARDIDFEKEGVCNPTCIKVDGILHMYYRAVAKDNYSSIGYCQIKNKKIIFRPLEPLLKPEFDYEKQGMEDPRITLIDGIYYLLYTAYDGQNARIAYATSTDLINFKKCGPISPAISYDKAEDIFRKSCNYNEDYEFFEKLFRRSRGENILLWEKDACLFPEKFNGKFALIHRVLPSIQIIYFEKFSDLSDDFWSNYLINLCNYFFLEPKYEYESGYIGGGCTPVKTEDGWLFIYHAAEETGNEQRVYHASAALLDINNPQKVIGRLKKPLFSPKMTWEQNGVVDNVVFPTGAIVDKDKLKIFYGAADTTIGIKTFSLKKLLKKLKDDR